MNSKTLKTLNYYNGIAKGYGNLYHQEQIHKISFIKNFIPKQGLFLDFGGGDGVLNQFLDKNQNIISFDLSFKLLKLNQNKFKINGDGTNLPFKNEIFDCVFAFTVLQDMSETRVGIKEILRVLKEKGLFICSFLQVSSKKKKLENFLKMNFQVLDEILEEKDVIYILKKKKRINDEAIPQ